MSMVYIELISSLAGFPFQWEEHGLAIDSKKYPLTIADAVMQRKWLSHKFLFHHTHALFPGSQRLFPASLAPPS
jgi:hypothetical protein